MSGTEESRTLTLSSGQTISTLLTAAPEAFACLVLAHGAGAGMRHRFMAAVAEGLARRGVSTLRLQFPSMEAGSKRVDSPAVAHAAVRAAVDAAGSALPLFAGGKSFGGRMTSQAQAIEPLAHVRGLVFFGFPLHPAGKPSIDRALHLSDVHIPMLFLQGTRNALGMASSACASVRPDLAGTWKLWSASGMLDETASWMGALLHASP